MTLTTKSCEHLFVSIEVFYIIYSFSVIQADCCYRHTVAGIIVQQMWRNTADYMAGKSKRKTVKAAFKTCSQQALIG